MPAKASTLRRAKRVELEIARLLDGKRALQEGIAGGSDVTTPYRLHLDVKSRQSISRKWELWLIEAERNRATVRQLGDWAIMRVGSLKAFATGELPIPYAGLAVTRLPKTPLTWLDHMCAHCEDGNLPCVVLHRPGSQYKSAVALARLSDFEHWLGGVDLEIKLVVVKQA